MTLLPDYSYAQLRSLATKIRAGGQADARPLIIDNLVRDIGTNSTATVLDCLADERERNERRADQRVELVWSGPEQEGAGSRDTPALVRQLFKSAERFVIVSGYVVYDGESIFDELAARMVGNPMIVCWLFLNVKREKDDDRSEELIVREFSGRFFRRDWPWSQRPRLFYDPRALVKYPSPRAVLHAKCIVVDDQRALVTSANLTEAAYYRNIECGVLLSDHVFAKQLADQFRGLVGAGILREISQ